MTAQRLELTGGVPPASKANLGLNVTCISVIITHLNDHSMDVNVDGR